VDAFVQALAAQVGVISDAPALEEGQPWLATVAADLQANQGRSLVVGGPFLSAATQALIHAINDALGNTGQTVVYTDPVEANPVNQTESLQALIEAMNNDQVELLVMLGGNPVYSAPADLNFGEAFDKVPLRIHLSLYEDETSYLSHWHIPASHSLESWSDAKAYDGTTTIMQPLIAPLYDSHSAHELLSALMGEIGTSGHDIVKGYWESQQSGGDFETFWQTSLHDGLVADTALPVKSVSVQTANLSSTASEASGLEISFRPDASIWDGSYANNGWLQELPRPLTKLTWDNAILVSPATAIENNLSNEDLVELSYQGRSVTGPVWILPGQADGVVTINFGYGRTRAGQAGSEVGFNAYALQTSASPYSGSGVELRKSGGTQKLVTTQEHHSMEGRHLVREGTLAEFEAHPEFVHEFDHHESDENLSLYPGFEYNNNAWGMTINLSACIGCNACTIACQAENNIPVVGKDQVAIGREMHWIRVDRYFEGDLDDPHTYHQPVTCMHCENAPCEVVCPVAATVHSEEGLNDMVYNRCVGTRYCSNNCPYKVRRFNFFQYNDNTIPVLRLLHNPDVTVRDRGVMEKCTYCVQRINAARIEAKKEGRPIRDGEIVTACQGACPTQAIVFGNINDADSEVARTKASPLNYSLLGELATEPRTTYLARISNPNPELETE
jgi:molybdopterin-containing oxidoreductase family iron-sulfur binding subunit